MHEQLVHSVTLLIPYSKLEHLGINQLSDIQATGFIGKGDIEEVTP